MKEIELIDLMIDRLKSLKSSIKKKDKISDKAFNMNPQNSTPRQIQKASTDLNWQCMEVDKGKTEIARIFKGSCLDVDTGEKEYNPSGFHKYKG